MPTSPTCDVTRNIDVGENVRLVTGDITRKQSISLHQQQQLVMGRDVNLTVTKSKFKPLTPTVNIRVQL